MQINEIRATPKIKLKLREKHRMEWYEVEEAMARRGLQPRRAGFIGKQRAYSVETMTESGRKLKVFFLSAGHSAQIVTAYDI